jgi:hypothetical protein
MSEQGPEGGNKASTGAGGDNTGDQAGKNDAAKTTADAVTAQKGPPESAGAATDASNGGTTAVAATTSDQKAAGDATSVPDGTGGEKTGDQAGKDDTAKVAAENSNKSETGTLNDTAKTGDTEKSTPVIADATTAEKGPALPAKATTDGTGDTTAVAAAATTTDQKVAGDATGTPDGTGGDNAGLQAGKDDTAKVAAANGNKSETGTLNDTAKTGDTANTTAVTATEATAQIGPAPPMKASGTADVLGDGDRVELQQTTHGAERAADASRLNPAQQAEVIKNSTDTYTQADGATVHEQNVNGRYNVVVVGKYGVVTNFKTLEPEKRDGVAKRYGWVKN